MSDADRIARAKARRSRSEEEVRLERQERERDAVIQRALAEAIALIPEILRLLEQRNFPGVLEIEYLEPTFFGGTRKICKGAWPIGTEWDHRKETNLLVWLRSDGQIGFSKHRGTADDPYARLDVYVRPITAFTGATRVRINSLLQDFKGKVIRGEVA